MTVFCLIINANLCLNMFVLRVRSGVASYGALEHVLPRVLENIDLTVKISKITKEKQVLHFRLARQKHDKTHVNRLKQSRNQKYPGQRRKGKIYVVPLTSFPGDATACTCACVCMFVCVCVCTCMSNWHSLLS